MGAPGRPSPQHRQGKAPALALKKYSSDSLPGILLSFCFHLRFKY